MNLLHYKTCFKSQNTNQSTNFVEQIPLVKPVLVDRHKNNLTVCVIQKHFNEIRESI